MAKPGPHTDAGKAIVRHNAIQHGILSSTPVVRGLERDDDWHAHQAGTLASLAPEGRLEHELAERVALMLWRLRRVVRFETESINIAQESVEEETIPNILNAIMAGQDLPSEVLADRSRRMRILPTDHLQLITRYEAHLSRQLYQALHELEALRARRRGEAAPLARLEVHGAPSD